MTLSSCSVYLCLLRTGMQACTTMEGYTGCSDSFSLFDLSHDSFHYCLAFPLVFIAVIVFSSLLSYAPLGHSFILKQQFLGTDKILFKSFFFVVWDTPSSEYVFGDTMSLISCNLGFHGFGSPLQYWVHRGDTTEPPANWESGTQMEWLEVLWQSPTHFFPLVSDIDSIPQRRLQGIHCNGRFIYATSGEL